MDDVKVENVPYNVIPVTEYDPFEVGVLNLLLYIKSCRPYNTLNDRDFVASGK